MSETLGPIHYLMYEKIKYQDELVERLLEAQPELLARLSEKMPPVDTGSLDDLIDQPNIHGWLSSRIDMAESRLAFALARAKEPLRLMREAGRAAGPEESDLKQLYQEMLPYLLDGMPCDGALYAQYEPEQEILYLVEEHDMHKLYADHLLAVDPEDSLGKTCAGDHDHDEHPTFMLREDEDFSAEDFEAEVLGEGLGADTEEETEGDLFHRARLAWLEGFLEETPFRAEMINGRNYKIYAQ